MRPRYVLALIVLVLTGGCDRFADEMRTLDVQVMSVNGSNVRLAEVHVVLDFDPTFPLSSSPPVPYTTPGQTNVRFDVARRSDGAVLINGAEIGLVGPGVHTVDVSELPIPNGLYTLQVESGGTVLAEEAFVINRVPETLGQYAPLGYTGPDGRVSFRHQTLSVDTEVVLSSDSSGKVARSVGDMLTLWVVPRTGLPQAQQVTLRPVGTTRVVVTIE